MFEAFPTNTVIRLPAITHDDTAGLYPLFDQTYQGRRIAVMHLVMVTSLFAISLNDPKYSGAVHSVSTMVFSLPDFCLIFFGDFPRVIKLIFTHVLKQHFKTLFALRLVPLDSTERSMEYAY